jgi:hypothetical protein
MVVGITSLGAHGLERFNGCEGIVADQAGGQTSLDFGYGKPVVFPTAFCVAFPWRTSYDKEEGSVENGASFSGD